MALSTSFFGGWFFQGQFFDHAVWGREPLREVRDRQRSAEDIRKSRGRFQVFTTAEDIIASLAEELITEDSEQMVRRRLMDAMAEHHIDWDDAFLQQFFDAREQSPAWQERMHTKAEEAERQWYARRQAKLRRLH